MNKRNSAGPNSGDERWRFDPESTVQVVEVSKNTVYAGTYSGSLYAIDAATGTKQWENVYSDYNRTINHLGVGGSHIIAANSRYISGVSRNAGVTQWEFDLGEGNTPLGVSVDDEEETVYVGNRNAGEVFALNTELGTQRWCFSPAKSGQLGPLTVTDETVFLRGENCEFYAVDATSGTEQWHSKTPEDCEFAIVGEGRVYAATEDGCLYGFDKNTGTEQWKSEFELEIEHSGIGSAKISWLDVGEETMFVGTNTGGLLGLSLTPTGARREWQFKLDADQGEYPIGRRIGRINAYKGTVYIGTHNSEPACLCAVDANSGSEQWRFEITSDSYINVDSLAVGEETMCAGTSNGLYAVATEHNESSNSQSTVSAEGRLPSDRTGQEAVLNCQSCGIDLTEYGDINFCPECGTEIDFDRDTDTKIYDQ